MGRPRGRPRKHPPKSKTLMLGIQTVCPMSGTRYTDPTTGKFREIPMHYMAARMCRTERAIFLVCMSHEVRAFMSQPVLVADIKRTEGLDASSSPQKRHTASA